MSTFEKQFGHLKETDPIAYYDLKGNPCGADSDTTGVEAFFVILIALGIWGLIAFLT
jgi:hypothetical protein